MKKKIFYWFWNYTELEDSHKTATNQARGAEMYLISYCQWWAKCLIKVLFSDLRVIASMNINRLTNSHLECTVIVKSLDERAESLPPCLRRELPWKQCCQSHGFTCRCGLQGSEPGLCSKQGHYILRASGSMHPTHSPLLPHGTPFKGRLT